MNRKCAPRWLIRLGAEIPQAVIGTKAYNLSILHRLGFAVPPCVFVATLNSEFANFESADAYLASIEEFSRDLQQYVPAKQGWSVRSSATVEDMPGESHAGRFETVFISKAADLAGAVQDVWKSAESGEIGAESMGVVVQELVDADYAGVALSHDPASRDQSTVIEAVPGIAASFVEGEVAPCRIRMGDKNRSLPEGLTSPILLALDEGVKRLRVELGTEVDTEWALADGTLYWLQVRPLTGSSFREFVIPDWQRTKLKGLWVRINHSYAPLVPLVTSMNPGGYIDGPGWASCLVNNFHYIHQESAPHLSVRKGEFDRVLDEWDDWEQQFGPLFNERRQIDLRSLNRAGLWQETLQRIELSQTFFEHYSDRRFPEIRDRTEQGVIAMIGRAVNDESSAIGLLSQLLGELGSLTEEKQRQLKRLARIRSADRTRDIRKLPEWQEFIDSFGFESATTQLFYLPTLKETPDLIVTLIDQTDCRARDSEVIEGWRAVADSILAKLEDADHREFMSQLMRLRRCMLRTEDDDYALAKCTMLVREAFLQCGDRLAEEKSIACRDDVFFLMGTELQQALVDDHVPNFLDDVASRKEEFEHSKLLSPPPMIVNGRAMTGRTRKFGERLVGTPASPGVASGTVFVLSDPFKCLGKQLPKNSVVVAPIVTPALAYSLVGCAALVTEIGGIASHGAIVAREMSIPAIVGVAGARSVLATGMSVSVNGSNGEIDIMRRSR